MQLCRVRHATAQSHRWLHTRIIQPPLSCFESRSAIFPKCTLLVSETAQMPSALNHPVLLAAVREGNEPRVENAVRDLPQGWLAEHGEGLITMAQRHGQFAMMTTLRRLRDAEAAADNTASKLGSEFHQELTRARNLARAATTSALRVPALDAHNHAGLSADAVNRLPHAYDPLRHMMADGASTGRSSARSSKSGGGRSDRSTRSSKGSKRRSGKGSKRHGRLHDSASDDGDAASIGESELDSMSEAEVLDELDEMLDYAGTNGLQAAGITRDHLMSPCVCICITVRGPCAPRYVLHVRAASLVKQRFASYSWVAALLRFEPLTPDSTPDSTPVWQGLLEFVGSQEPAEPPLLQHEPTPRTLELKDLTASELRTLIYSLGGKGLIPPVVVEKAELTAIAVQQLASAPLPLIDEVHPRLPDMATVAR